MDHHPMPCTHSCDHITQQIHDLSDTTQQHSLHSMEENTSLFTDDSTTLCDFNITEENLDTETPTSNITSSIPKTFGIHSQSRNTFGESNKQYHDFDNNDVLTFTDKYTALLQQELQNPYWCLHDPITTKSYQISKRYRH